MQILQATWLPLSIPIQAGEEFRYRQFETGKHVSTGQHRTVTQHFRIGGYMGDAHLSALTINDPHHCMPTFERKFSAQHQNGVCVNSVALSPNARRAVLEEDARE